MRHREGVIITGKLCASADLRFMSDPDGHLQSLTSRTRREQPRAGNVEAGCTDDHGSSVLTDKLLAQSIIPTLLQPAPGSKEEQELNDFHSRYVKTLEDNAEFVRTRVAEIPGLSVMVPEGAMYAMVSTPNN